MIDTSNTSTSATTPAHIWVHEVVTLAAVSVEEMESYCGRDRVLMWYDAGEPVWMAADSLRHFVKSGKTHARAEREINYLDGKIKEHAK